MIREFIKKKELRGENMKNSDENIKQKIRHQIQWDDRINDIDIDIEVNNGDITFSGYIPSYYAKVLVTENAKKISGVKSIYNNLKVRYLPVVKKDLPIDGELEKNIKIALELNVSINASKINVSVNNGIVSLGGIVDAFWKKEIAESIASEFNGVIDIVNKIAVVPSDHKDQKIAEDIIATCERYRNVDVDNLDLKVKDGEVSISGNVDDWEAYDAIMDTLRYTHGVKIIDDNLVIENM